MKIRIESGKACGTVKAPPSKSISHRALIAAALSRGAASIHGISESGDINATIRALNALGCNIDLCGDTAFVGDINPTDTAFFDCGESGSTLRFMIPIFASLGIEAEIFGHGRLLSRPLSVYENIPSLSLKRSEKSLSVSGMLFPGKYTVRGDISSQFISGLIFALAIVSGESAIEITPPIVSSPYIDMTVKTMRDFGFDVRRDGDMITLVGGQGTEISEYFVEGDYSNASELSAFGEIGGNVAVKGLSPDSLQGDKAYISYFDDITEHRPIDISQTPDLGPILIALMAAKSGGVLTGTKRLRDKESDRAEAMRCELMKFGIDIDVFDDMISVPDMPLTCPKETLFSHNDHRIAMALALLCTITGGEIENAECTDKSYPEYWNDLKKLGINITAL